MIFSREEILVKAVALKAKGKKVGFTSGSFDLVHSGHIAYLDEAKKKCDFLIVGVNSDSSIKKYKSEFRPIRKESDRLFLLANLKCVDAAFIFSETNNQTNIELIKPDFYFKAGDYKVSDLSSAPIVEEYGGKVEILKFKAGYSSTNIINRAVVSVLGDLYKHGPDKVKEKRPALFLDRDGTLIESVSYLHEPKKVKIIPGVIETLKKFQTAGYRLIIVTNQQGIGLGYITKEQFFDVNLEMLKSFGKAGIKIDKIYYCPHSVSEDCECRKPNTYFADLAKKELNIDLENSIMVGDSEVDIQFAKKASIKAVFFTSKESSTDLQTDSIIKSFSELDGFL